MSRFTKLANGKTCCTYFGWSEECKRVQGHCCECKINDMAWNTLKEYEDAEEEGFLQIMSCMGCEFEEKYWMEYPCYDCIRNNKTQPSDNYQVTEGFDKFYKSILNELE